MTHSRSRKRKRKYNDGFVEVRGRGDRLLFRYDSQRDLIEVKPKGGDVEVVDLRRLKAGVESIGE